MQSLASAAGRPGKPEPLGARPFDLCNAPVGCNEISLSPVVARSLVRPLVRRPSWPLSRLVVSVRRGGAPSLSCSSGARRQRHCLKSAGGSGIYYAVCSQPACRTSTWSPAPAPPTSRRADHNSQAEKAGADRLIASYSSPRSTVPGARLFGAKADGLAGGLGGPLALNKHRPGSSTGRRRAPQRSGRRRWRWSKLIDANPVRPIHRAERRNNGRAARQAIYF